MSSNALPERGSKWEEILETIGRYKADDLGCMRLNANSMKGSADVQEVGKEAFLEFFQFVDR